jgi:hypothetical protein
MFYVEHRCGKRKQARALTGRSVLRRTLLANGEARLMFYVEHNERVFYVEQIVKKIRLRSTLLI